MALGVPDGLSQMELDSPSIQDLVHQFEALPGDLVGMSRIDPLTLHIATLLPAQPLTTPAP